MILVLEDRYESLSIDTKKVPVALHHNDVLILQSDKNRTVFLLAQKCQISLGKEALPPAPPLLSITLQHLGEAILDPPVANHHFFYLLIYLVLLLSKSSKLATLFFCASKSVTKVQMKTYVIFNWNIFRLK